MISIDKVMAVAFPLRHSNIMKPRVVFGIISAMWVLPIVLYVQHLFNSKGFNKVAKFGTCFTTDSNIPVKLLTVVLPLSIHFVLTAFLNIYLTIKAYKVYKQMKEEGKPLGGHNRDNDRLKSLKNQDNIKKHIKLIFTLLVVVLGSDVLIEILQ